ncbi:MAG TPA: hypothetical protein VJP80_05745 [Candidatus Saccharimonadales bacterium]|nr:hypothetical protein [Candidatus Saccharimonadales bacterium]
MARISHTPLLSNVALENYLKNDLANELHWMLRAAVEWRIQSQIRLKVSGYHMQVFAMDSTFLHARTLFEFFTCKTTGNHYGYDAYRISMPLISTAPDIVDTVYLSGNWNGALHAYLMHAQDRTVARRLPSFDGTKTKDIKRMPVDFAQEVVRLWREFAQQLGRSSESDIQKLEVIALDILKEAIAQTMDIYTRKKIVVMKRRFPVKHISW